MTIQRERIQRHRTAIGRRVLSIGAKTAYEDGLTASSVLDFGCGRGDDVAALVSRGVDVAGWDPHFAPHTDLAPRSTVLMTYVLNTIEDPAERLDVVKRAWALTQDVMIVTTRLQWDRRRVKGEALEDGVVTSRNTFQHLFTTPELARLVESAAGVRSVVALPGVVYVFRSEQRRLAYLLKRHGIADVQLGDALSLLEQARDFLHRRGRLPLPCDGLSRPLEPAMREAARRSVDKEVVESALRHLTLETLYFLTMERFSGELAWQSMPEPLQADIRACFGTFRHARFRSDRLLRQLRDRELLRQVMRRSVGKPTASAHYVHRRALESLPLLLRVYEACGALAAGRPSEWNVVKLHHDKHMISWLSYPRFDEEPHPSLNSSYYVDLATLKVGGASYRESNNPPILHRKHEFLVADDPRAELYRRLTAQEIRAGLYEHPETIGTREGWQRELSQAGRVLSGHRLIRQRDAAGRTDLPSRVPMSGDSS